LFFNVLNQDKTLMLFIRNKVTMAMNMVKFRATCKNY
jgi:hypothetical protein